MNAEARTIIVGEIVHSDMVAIGPIVQDDPKNKVHPKASRSFQRPDRGERGPWILSAQAVKPFLEDFQSLQDEGKSGKPLLPQASKGHLQLLIAHLY